MTFTDEQRDVIGMAHYGNIVTDTPVAQGCM